MEAFTPSAEKIERAKKHINDLIMLLDEFAHSQFYDIAVEEKTWKYGWLRNEISVTVHTDTDKFRTSAALIIGDAVHNIRSALDFLYYQTVLKCRSHVDEWTMFPIKETREKLEQSLKGALKQKKIRTQISHSILEEIRSYSGGNPALWTLHKLDNWDKHQLLIPTFQLMAINDIRLTDEKNIIHNFGPIFTSESYKRYIPEDEYGRYPKVHDKGRASIGIGFNSGVPCEGESVIVTLNGIAEEVTRMVEAFKIAGFV